jgi:pyruvate dehydrogenase E2 component (dihydrolipoamide acetyltransferase)
VSPRARRLAAARGLDPTTLVGSGPGGAVVGVDVERAPAPAPSGRRSKAERLAARRRAIGELMARSWREIPHYRLSRRIDLSVALGWLDEHNAAASVDDRVLPAALLLRATALAAAKVPAVNGTFEHGQHVRSEHVHLGVAVALREGGLVTPRIAEADTKSLTEVMAELRDLVTRARAGRLRASETAGATITVTNLGDLGVDEVHGIIFPPQVALVGFGAVLDEPWAVDGELVVRPTVHATLAADHRVSDGRVGGQFLTTLERLLKEPDQL